MKKKLVSCYQDTPVKFSEESRITFVFDFFPIIAFDTSEEPLRSISLYLPHSHFIKRKLAVFTLVLYKLITTLAFCNFYKSPVP